MVKILSIIVFLIFLNNVFAITGTITVLEAPIFAVPDEKSKVVQYYRKGDLIYIHPQEAFKDRYVDEIDFLTIGIEADHINDPLFKDKKVYYPPEDGQFLKTITRNGMEAYILKEHLILNYKDPREFQNKVIEHDHTDYRISEPLRPGYPFEMDTGYRSLTQFALGRPNFQAYPFQENISDTEISFSKELSYIWSKARKVNKENRFFFGLMLSLANSSVSYLLNTQSAKQDYTRFSLGPLASYDILRSHKYALNAYLSIQTSLLDRMEVSIDDPTNDIKETRSYQSILPFSSLVGVNYQFFKSLYVFDTVIGTNVRFNLPKSYTTSNNASEINFWRSQGRDDSFVQSFTSEVNFFFGLQSNI